jgi:purine-binding chemotaxis protein CheW
MVNPGQFLTFLLRGQFYGVPIAAVREINRFIEVTPIPQTPSFVAGVMNLRGKVIPVVNLREKFGFEPVKNSKETCIVIIETGDGQMGVIVDAVRSVVDLTAAQIEPTPRLGEESVESIILGLGKLDDKVVILIDIAATLSKDHLKQVVSLAHISAPKISA